jgi:hypothetical protein
MPLGVFGQRRTDPLRTFCRQSDKPSEMPRQSLHIASVPFVTGIIKIPTFVGENSPAKMIK